MSCVYIIDNRYYISIFYKFIITSSIVVAFIHIHLVYKHSRNPCSNHDEAVPHAPPPHPPPPRAGLLPADEALAEWLRRQLGPVRLSKLLLVVNKCERRGRAQTAGVADMLAEAAGLGLGDPVAMSAQTGEGLTELYAALQPLVDALTGGQSDGEAEGEEGLVAVGGMQGNGTRRQARVFMACSCVDEDMCVESPV